MSDVIRGRLYSRDISIDAPTFRELAEVATGAEWSYNVVGRGGYWRDDEESWYYEPELDDVQDESAFGRAVRSVVDAGGGAILLAKDVDGTTVGLRLGIAPGTESYREVHVSVGRPDPFFEDPSKQSVLVDLFADLAESVSPSLAFLDTAQFVPQLGDDDDVEDPTFFLGVTYFPSTSVDVSIEDLRPVVEEVRELSDGILLLACENAVTGCWPDDVEDLEAYLGMKYYFE